MPLLIPRPVSRPDPGAVWVTPVAEGAPPPQAARDAAHEELFVGRAGQVCTAFVPSANGLLPDRRLLLVGLGDQSDAAGRDAGARAVARLPATATRVVIDARGLSCTLAVAIAEGAAMRSWRPPSQRHTPDPDAPRLAAIDVLMDAPTDVAASRCWARLRAVLAGASLARDLVAEPSNTLTPAGFVSRVTPALRQAGVEIDVLRPRELRELGFGAVLAVGGASANRPRLVVLRWPGIGSGAPLGLVGKGITFDTGGISIKPAHGMWEMRADMAGAAACVGAMLAVARRNTSLPVVAVLPLAENAVGDNAYRPSDVVRTRGGMTVEIVDTDAEGRLVLADALAHMIATFRPRAIVDLATLTGSIIVALGRHRAGLFDNDHALAAAVSAAADAVGEPVWRMPIGARHRSDLDSNIADIRHCVPGRMQPDASHAAAFLREFVDQTPWVHLDIAGMESCAEASDLQAEGATGFGVRLLDALIAGMEAAIEEAAA